MEIAPGIPDLIAPNRRQFLRTASSLVIAYTTPAFAQQDFWSLPRELWLQRAETGEEVRTVYWDNGELLQEGYYELCTILRDTHRNLAVQFDITMLDIARGIYGWLTAFGLQRPLIVTSGYRHPLTNASEGGVKNSYHTKAQAIDLRISGVSADKVSAFGRYLAAGGVGFYAAKDFTHLDCGKLRTWRG